MPDITMCRNQFCAIKESCYRWSAEPNPHWQAYAWFKEPRDGEKCLNFIETAHKNNVSDVEHPHVVDTI